MKRYASQLHEYHAVDPDELSYHLASLFFQAEKRATRPRGLIVPHDPVSLSGYVAAKAYLSLRKYSSMINRVIILAAHPSPHIDQLVTSSASFFCSPIGDIKIEQGCFDALQAKTISFDDDLFKQALALDVQLPFLQLCLSNFTLLPVLVGEYADTELNHLLDSCWDDKTLLIVCSNLSQGVEYPDACAFDKATLDALIARHSLAVNQSASAAALLNMLSSYWHQKNMLVKLINYQHSYEVNPKHQPFTGYGSCLIY
ncbi:AmmeMemoRadiSam system protein B [Algibacillus agarilyticus]|uniref:AmmeMemoRadiSam system protein B n=1 Tax=Algibacillus agarilyticus TaxID=2234133 RepID=UPI000DD07B43|nr:AmmeMemoRadiSam system protein B [Algibacillus agarilyticus]